MGWKPYPTSCRDGTNLAWIKPSESWELMGTVVYFTPDYSTSIAAAWKVVEKMGLETITRWNGSWLCTNVGSDFFHQGEHADRYEFLNEGSYAELADTAPLAISRAALKAVGG